MTTPGTAQHQNGYSFVVRPFAPEDRDAVLSLAPRLTVGIASWLDPNAFLEAARNWIEASLGAIGPDAVVLIAEDNEGQVVGFVTGARSRHFTGIEQIYIGELAVAERCEGRGIGRALIAELQTWARHQGVGLLALETGAANRRARDFYLKLGFAEESVRMAQVMSSEPKFA